MQTYTKINTLYCRFQKIRKDCPNEKWRKWSHKIIKGYFADSVFEYLFRNQFEAYSKIDGTNSKIAYYPSTQQIVVGGKSDDSQSQHGSFEYLQKVAERILPILKEMYPVSCAKFVPEPDENGKPLVEHIIIDNADFFTVRMVEVPIYIYGEYYGKGIANKVGYRYSEENRFTVFDICQQGWWIPSDARHEICKKLELEEVPRHENMTIEEAEIKVKEGFTTCIDNPADPTLLEEGLVLRPTCPIKTPRNKRIIVKVKYRDYVEYKAVRKEFTNAEIKEFLTWYFTEIEPKDEEFINMVYNTMYEPFLN